ncbi:MAG: hypothetical protein J2P36_19335, partial [Ktedonobacteraceae bacterium]|nr:hypothetical protein [Ktedonobacteraceae bacterium]
MAGETDRGREETSPEGQAPGVLRDIRDAAHSDSSAPQSDKRQPGSSDAGEQRIERVEAALAERDERMKESQGSWSQDHFHGYHLTNNHGFAVKIVAGEIKKAGGMLSEERLSEFHEANWEWRQGQLNDREHRYAAAVEQSNAEIEATLGL